MRCAFTLIELLVVVAIIAVLAGLSITGVSIARNKQKEAAARTQLQGISLALSTYLSDYGIIGDERSASPTDFDLNAASFLIHRPISAKRLPYIDESIKSLGTSSESQVQNLSDAVHILDPWGMRIRFGITNASSRNNGTYDHTVRITLTCTHGTPDSSKDDLVLTYDLDKDAWNWN